MPDHPNQNEGIESKRDARELEIKNEGIKSGCNARNKKEGIESRHDAGEPEIKKEGINLGAMPENSKQN